MKIVSALLAHFLLVIPAQDSRMCDFARLQEEIRWCLIEAPDEIRGRERMIQALHREGSPTDIYQLRIGYGDCHDRDQDKLRNFLECRRDDPIGLFNYGRELLDLPPVSNDL